MKFDLESIARMDYLSHKMASRLKRHERHLREKAASEVRAAEQIDAILRSKPLGQTKA